MLAIPLVSGGQIEGVYLALLPLTAIASFEAVQPLSLALQQLEASQAAGRRLFELIDTPPEVHDPRAALQGTSPARPSDVRHSHDSLILNVRPLQGGRAAGARRGEFHDPGVAAASPSSGRADRANRRS